MGKFAKTQSLINFIPEKNLQTVSHRAWNSDPALHQNLLHPHSCSMHLPASKDHTTSCM